MNSWLSVAFDVVTRTLLFLFIRKVLVQCNRTVLGFYSEYKWETSKVLAFFHPYCDSGGGGERVLWMTINAILEGCDSQADVHIVIYSGSTRSKIDVLRHVRDRFSINLLSPYTSNKITLIPIYSHVLMEAHRYPYATMIFQCLASILVGLECVLKLCPNIYIDTTGAAFTYPLFRILDPSCKVLAYVHYPIISSDMLRKVREKRPDYNNRESISKSETISRLKLLYYSLIARMYGLVGSWANEVMVNSTWTKNHIDGLWGVKARLLYPPCNTEMAQNILLDGEARLKQGGGRYIVSVGQFRPEKDHFLQLRALKALLDGEEGGRFSHTRLIMIGSTRNEADEALLQSIEREAARLGLGDRVDFVVNAPYSTLLEWFAKGHVGLHTMWNEHFGISVVEMMAAGLLTVAHDTAGPAQDIVVPAIRAQDLKSSQGGVTVTKEIGYLASTVEEYAACLADALDSSASAGGQNTTSSSTSASTKAKVIQLQARESVKRRFSDDMFSTYLHSLVRAVLADSQRQEASFMHSVWARLAQPLAELRAAKAKKED